MRQPRFSLSWLAFCVLIAAFDFAVLRGFPTSERAWLYLFALPMVNILVITLWIDRRDRRHGQRSRFLLGFQSIGWVAVLSYLGWCMMRPEGIAWALAYTSEWVHWVTLNNLDFDTMKRLDPEFGLAWRLSKASQGIAVSVALTAIMSLVAAFGGFLVSRSRRESVSAFYEPADVKPRD